MRSALMRKFVTMVATGVCLSAPVRAEGFFETIFGFMSAKPAAVPSTLTVYRQPRKADAHLRHKEKTQVANEPRRALSESEKYLMSASFSEKFRSSEAGQKQTREAIGYLIAHDDTLRRGDALVTQNGVLVFDPDRGESGAFLPATDRSVGKPLKDRLVGFGEPGARYGSALAGHTRSAGAAKPDASAEQQIQTADGRTIRFVGGSPSPVGSSTPNHDADKPRDSLPD